MGLVRFIKLLNISFVISDRNYAAILMKNYIIKIAMVK